jgi:chromosome segregation ATPase
MIEVSNDITTTAVAITGGVGGILFGLQKAIKSWSADRGDIQKNSIDSDLFQRMSAEISRLAATNQQQEQEIAELREKFTSLLNEFTQFRMENAKQAIELATLKERLKRYEP